MAGPFEIKFPQVRRVLGIARMCGRALMLACAVGPAIAADAPDDDVLAHALQAEFALQAGELPQAAAGYAAAAAHSRRTDLIERAATVALCRLALA